jgi:hypothetical protein
MKSPVKSNLRRQVPLFAGAGPEYFIVITDDAGETVCTVGSRDKEAPADHQNRAAELVGLINMGLQVGRD